MKPEMMKQTLNSLKDYVSNIQDLNEDKEVQLIKSQLRVIEKTIKHFERNGIQVPEGIMSDKQTLELKINEIKKGPQELLSLYQELLDVIVKISAALKRRPDKDLMKCKREERKRELSGDILRKSIVLAMKELKGHGHERDIIKIIEEKIKGQFTPSDLLRPFGKQPRWVMNVRHERNLMIKEGILTPDSNRKKWTLQK